MVALCQIAEWLRMSRAAYSKAWSNINSNTEILKFTCGYRIRALNIRIPALRVNISCIGIVQLGLKQTVCASFLSCNITVYTCNRNSMYI